MTKHPSEMSWSELDPASHPFDRERVEAAIEVAVSSFADRMSEPGINTACVGLIDRVIATHAGTWASGWTWAASEPGGGGPVGGWCCEADSVFREDDESWRDTAARAFAALVDWRDFLEELAVVFAHLRAETASMPVALELALAVQKIVSIVVARTQASDAWYGTLEAALRWYVELAGLSPHDDQPLDDIVSRAVEGRFESWVAPSAEVTAANAEHIAEDLARQLGADQRDALAAWRIARTHPAQIALRVPDFTIADGHARYIEEHDRARDPLRADRMAAALLLARDAVAQPLTFDLLSEWQRVVLGERAPAPFRTTTAYAKQGREEYRYSPDVPLAFDAALAEAGDPDVRASIRAARVYLDVCFFHPFADGNARAARLALDHTLARANLRLTNAGPAFQIARSPELGLWELARVIEATTARFR